MIRRVEHIGIAVPNVDEAIPVYERFFGRPFSRRVDDPVQRVKAAFIGIGDNEIELIEPTDPDGGVARFVARRGAALHHICYEVDDLSTELDRLVSEGATLIDQAPREVVVDGPIARYAWVHQKSLGGVLIELIERR